MSFDQTVYVIDDDSTIREFISDMLENVNISTKCFSNATDFLEQYETHHNGCLVLDIRMAGMSGLALQERLKELEINLPIIFITAHADVPVAVKALKAGAFDFIEKPFPLNTLLDSINAALAHNLAINLNKSESKQIEKNLEKLTNREKEVMQLLIKGNTNKQIASLLQISPRTVEAHRQHMLQKLEVHNLSDLINLIEKEELTV